MFEQAFRNIDDVLRKEAGCTTELDYTEQTSWLLFLKYLDGLEEDRADLAKLDGKRYTYLLDKPYRWETWAAPKDKEGKLDHHKAMAGDDLRDFVNDSLFPYLQKFKAKATSPNTLEYKIGEIFGEIQNKIQSGYNLREIIDAHRRTPLPFPDREARALASLRSQDQEHGQRRAERRRVLHPSPPHPRHRRRSPQPRLGETHLRRRRRLGGFLVRSLRLPPKQQNPKRTTAQDRRPAGSAPFTARKRSPSPTSSRS